MSFVLNTTININNTIMYKRSLILHSIVVVYIYHTCTRYTIMGTKMSEYLWYPFLFSVFLPRQVSTPELLEPETKAVL